MRAQRRELQDAYGRIGTAAASADVRATVGPEALGAVLIQLAELVIQLRRRGEPGDADRDAIAATCLRACGLGSAEIARARREAEELMATVPAS